MIERDRGMVFLLCDECSTDSEAFDKDKFDDMINFAKDDGWYITKVDGEWKHLCPDCSEVEIEDS